jgi:hypothetical protein
MINTDSNKNVAQARLEGNEGSASNVNFKK